MAATPRYTRDDELYLLEINQETSVIDAWDDAGLWYVDNEYDVSDDWDGSFPGPVA